MKNSISAEIRHLDLLQQSNAIMYFLYSAFGFRKFFHSDLVREYEAKEGVELAVNAYNFMRKLTRKIIYLMFIYFVLFTLDNKCFGAVFILLTLGGAIAKEIVTLDMRAYNNVILMHVDPQRYAIGVINNYLLSEAATFTIAFVGVSWYLEIPVPVCLLYLAMYLSIHIVGEVFHISDYARCNYQPEENKWKGVVQLLALAVIVGMIALILTGKISISNSLVSWSAVAVIPMGILGYRILTRDFNYRRYYRYNLSVEALHKNDEVVVNTGRTTVNMTQMNREMVAGDIRSPAKGYDFLFKAFLTRYRKSFTGGILIKLAVITLGGLALIIVPSIKSLGFSGDYLINTVFEQSRLLIYVIYWFAEAGKGFIVSCFLQVDRFLVHYNFFRKSDAIAKNFRLRALTATGITLIPSLYMMLMFTIAYLIHSDSVDVTQLALLFMFVIVLSIFYSIYNVAAYYLMQPYGFDGQIVNKAYSIVDVVIYGLVYLSFEVRFSLTPVLLTVIAVVLAVISVVLYGAVVKLSPKNFRVR